MGSVEARTHSRKQGILVVAYSYRRVWLCRQTLPIKSTAWWMPRVVVWVPVSLRRGECDEGKLDELYSSPDGTRNGTLDKIC